MLLRSIPRLFRLVRCFSTPEEALKSLCKAATDKAFATATATMRNPMGWELVDKLEDTEVYHNTKYTNAHVYRRQGKVDCPPMKVISFVHNSANARSWNEPTIESRVLKNLGEHKIIYQKISMPWPLSVRDLVFAEALYPIEGGCAYVMASIDYVDAPPIPSAVRSIMNWGAIVAEENENDKDKCFVSYVSSWVLKEETTSLKEANYLVQRRNPCILKLRKHLID